MKTLVELSPEQHKHLNVVPNSGAKHVAQQNLINLRVTEVAKAACCMPIFFVRDNHSGNWVLTGFTSFVQGQNLLVRDDQWRALYTPTALQTHPFYLMQSPKDPQQYTIGLDPESSALTTEPGETMFDEHGKASLYLSNIKTLIETDLNNDMLTHKFSQKVVDLGLLKAVNIAVNHQHNASQSLNGLFTINEEKLQQLPSDSLKELSKLGYLSPLYAMLTSLYQLNALIQYHNQVADNNSITHIKLEASKV
ncbi:SapC family protein [Shewanella youngdeokensis]|uniref:SapC family protein n=1 Tax=Shewanella youngdeokensis TaxID=2999068 RepID=A0ABZ0JZT9_9GAMM|nr:SapC family protein [Shewanella sp. DAU334]